MLQSETDWPVLCHHIALFKELYFHSLSLATILDVQLRSFLQRRIHTGQDSPRKTLSPPSR